MLVRPAAIEGGDLNSKHDVHILCLQPDRDDQLARGRGDCARSAAFTPLALDAMGGVGVLWELFEEAGRGSRGLGIAVSGNGGTAFPALAWCPAARVRQAAFMAAIRDF